MGDTMLLRRMRRQHKKKATGKIWPTQACLGDRGSGENNDIVDKILVD